MGTLKLYMKMILVYSIIFFSALAYLNIYTNTDLYDKGRSMTMGLMFILLLLSISFKPFQNKFIWLFFITITVIVFEAVLIDACLGTSIFYDEIYLILVPFVTIWSGYQSRISEKQTRYIIFFFILIATYVGLMSLFITIGFSMNESQYAIEQKNAIGAIVNFAAAMALYMGFVDKNKNCIGRVVIYWSFFALLFVISLFLRSRSFLLALILYSCLIYLKNTRITFRFVKKIVMGSCVFIVIMVILEYCIETNVVTSFFDLIYNSLTKGKGFSGDLNALSTGRMERNIAAVEIINQSPFWGRLTYNANIGWVHNYLLLKLSDFGIIGSLPFTVFYFYFLSFIIKKIKKWQLSVYDMPYFVLLISFFVSLLEPGMPYGSGSVSFALYFLLGISLRSNHVADLSRKLTC